MSVNCFKCSFELDFKADSDIGRSEECPKCYANLRCCKMCSFYDTKAYNECKEPTADRIVEKEKANFCDHFKLAGDRKKGIDNLNSALAAANALFKK